MASTSSDLDYLTASPRRYNRKVIHPVLLSPRNIPADSSKSNLNVLRKFRDAVKLALAPEQIIAYLQLFQDALFPLGELKPPSPARTAVERAETKNSANAALVALMPVIGASMIGRTNAKQGARRIFAVLQNRRLNRHLIYSMIDEVISALFPELKIL